MRWCVAALCYTLGAVQSIRKCSSRCHPLPPIPTTARPAASPINTVPYSYIFTPRELTVPCPPMFSSTRHSGQYHFVVRAGMAESPTQSR